MGAVESSFMHPRPPPLALDEPLKAKLTSRYTLGADNSQNALQA